MVLGQPGLLHSKDTDMRPTASLTEPSQPFRSEQHLNEVWQELVETAFVAVWPTDQWLDDLLDSVETAS